MARSKTYEQGQIHRTRFLELAYERRGDHWRLIATESGSGIGPYYPTKGALVDDLGRMSVTFGCESPN